MQKKKEDVPILTHPHCAYHIVVLRVPHCGLIPTMLWSSSDKIAVGEWATSLLLPLVPMRSWQQHLATPCLQ